MKDISYGYINEIMSSMRRLLPAFFSVAPFLIMGVIFILVPACGHKDKAELVSDVNKLKVLYGQCMEYAIETDGKFPSRPSDLVIDGKFSQQDYNANKPKIGNDWRFHQNQKTSSRGENILISWEASNKGKRLVLRVNGAVILLEEDDFQAEISRQVSGGRNSKRPVEDVFQPSSKAMRVTKSHFAIIYRDTPYILVNKLSKQLQKDGVRPYIIRRRDTVNRPDYKISISVSAGSDFHRARRFKAGLWPILGDKPIRAADDKSMTNGGISAVNAQDKGLRIFWL